MTPLAIVPKLQKTRRHMLVLTCAGLLALGLSNLPLPCLLIWNVTPSVPRGLYLVLPGKPVALGQLAVCRLPTKYRELANDRGYLPRNIPLIKPVAAVGGMSVCREHSVVFVNGRAVAMARKADLHGRTLPRWSGCTVLGRVDVFLMNAKVPDSFDGRYFGPTAISLIEGRALPLMTETQTSRFGAPPASLRIEN